MKVLIFKGEEFQIIEEVDRASDFDLLYVKDRYGEIYELRRYEYSKQTDEYFKSILKLSNMAIQKVYGVEVTDGIQVLMQKVEYRNVIEEIVATGNNKKRIKRLCKQLSEENIKPHRYLVTSGELIYLINPADYQQISKPSRTKEDKIEFALRRTSIFIIASIFLGIVIVSIPLIKSISEELKVDNDITADSIEDDINLVHSEQIVEENIRESDDIRSGFRSIDREMVTSGEFSYIDSDTAIFKDKGMEKALKVLLDKGDDDLIYYSDLETVKEIVVIGSYVIKDHMDVFIVDQSSVLGDKYYDSITYKGQKVTVEERGQISTLEDLSMFPNLQTLILVRQSLVSLDGIESCNRLISLNVTDNFLRDLSPISSLPLLIVEAHQNQIEEIKIGVDLMKNIEVIGLSFNHIYNADVLAQGESLIAINLKHNQIQAQPNLEHLYDQLLNGKSEFDYKWETFGGNPFLVN